MRGVEQIPWLYDFVLHVGESAGLGRWREWLVRGARGRVLDVGTGTGRNLPLYQGVELVVGLDPDPVLLKRARRRAPGVPLVRGRAEALPFRDDAFDTVVSGLAFCTVEDPNAGLREVRRVLARGGLLRMLEHVRAEGVRGKLQDWTQPAYTAIAGGCHNNRHTERTVAGEGFEIEPSTRRARGMMRRFVARPPDDAAPPHPESATEPR